MSKLNVKEPSAMQRKMKRIVGVENDIIYVGTAREIRSLYKNLVKRKIAYPIFTDFPVFNPYKMYGLEIGENGDMMVINSDTILTLLLDYSIL